MLRDARSSSIALSPSRTPRSTSSISSGDWQSTTAWTDQGGYQRLGAVLATTGQFTRYPDHRRVRPRSDPHARLPGVRRRDLPAVRRRQRHGRSPSRRRSCSRRSACMVFAIARRAAGDRSRDGRRRDDRALSAAALLRLADPHRAVDRVHGDGGDPGLPARRATAAALRDFVLAGALFSATTLVRPAFVLMPFFFAIARAAARARRSERRRALKGWAALVVTAALALTPWFTYNYVNLGQLTLSPAGGIGRGLWEGTWQGRWRGRAAEGADATSPTPPPIAPSSIARVREIARRRRHAAPSRCCSTSTSGATSARSGTRRPIRWSAPARASTPIRNICASRDREHAARIRSATSSAA